MFAPFVEPDLVWDFQLKNVWSINCSGHKYGLVYPGIGWVVWRSKEALPEDLIFWVSYLGGEEAPWPSISRAPRRRSWVSTTC